MTLVAHLNVLFPVWRLTFNGKSTTASNLEAQKIKLIDYSQIFCTDIFHYIFSPIAQLGTLLIQAEE